jgi:divalent metal cation (Fe/Co/Zn/Cd) transporter
MVHDISVDEMDEKKYISYHLEVRDDLSIKEAHTLASNLENSIREELGRDIELNSHIEPMKNETILSSNVSPKEMEQVMAAIDVTDRKVGELEGIHNVLVRKIGENFFTSFHCLALADLSVDLVHEATNKFEYLMKNEMKQIKRVVIHVEPK